MVIYAPYISGDEPTYKLFAAFYNHYHDKWCSYWGKNCSRILAEMFERGLISPLDSIKASMDAMKAYDGVHKYNIGLYTTVCYLTGIDGKFEIAEYNEEEEIEDSDDECPRAKRPRREEAEEGAWLDDIMNDFGMDDFDECDSEEENEFDQKKWALKNLKKKSAIIQRKIAEMEAAK